MLNHDLKIATYKVNQHTSIIDIRDEITALTQHLLLDAYNRASAGETSTIILNFSRLKQINSPSINLLVVLLGRARQQQQRLAAFGLSRYLREILGLTGIDKLFDIYDTEAEALAAAEIGRNQHAMI
jgi:anti-sigma B factor antagonist